MRILESYHGRIVGNLEGRSDVTRGDLRAMYEFWNGAVILHASYSFDPMPDGKPSYDIFTSHVSIFGMHGCAERDELAEKIRTHFRDYDLAIIKDE